MRVSSLDALLKESTGLTVAQAAYIAGVSVRCVNRIVDEKILPKTLYHTNGSKRVVRPVACPFVHFYGHAQSQLTAQARMRIISESWDLIGRKNVAADELNRGDSKRALSHVDGCLSVDLRSFCDEALRRLATLKAALDLVIVEAGRKKGGPRIRGTTISPYSLAVELRESTREEILSRHMELSEETLELSLAWAEAHTRRR
jgi:uncharacterized protein (DUF433 family)